MANAPKEAGPTAQRVAANVRALRKARGLDLADVAAQLTKLGQPIGLTGVSKIELGTRRVDVDDLVALAAVLRVSPSRLLLPATASDEPVQVTPGVTTTERAAWLWAAGELPLGFSADDPDNDVFRSENRPHAPEDPWAGTLGKQEMGEHGLELGRLAYRAIRLQRRGVALGLIHQWLDHTSIVLKYVARPDSQLAEEWEDEILSSARQEGTDHGPR
jgi:transcriptional regulator with XRE-family HTH domain